MSQRKIVVLLEIGFSRLLPGVLNLAAIFFVAKILAPEDYGGFSIVLATVTTLGLFLFGPIQSSVIPLHSQHVAGGRQGQLERGLIGLVLLLALITGIASLILILLSWLTWQTALLLIANGLFTTWQAVLRARLQFWRYGFSALIQGGMLLALILTSLKSESSVDIAIEAYAVSYLVGFASTWLMTGATMPAKLPIADVRSLFHLGSWLTLSAMAEGAFILGFRYVIFYFGSAQFLGSFSVALDLAQRSVGVIINIASFAVVPRAFQLNARGATLAFKRALGRGALISGGLAACLLAIIVAGWHFGLLRGVVDEAFSIVAFIMLSIAIVINRLKKLAIDPLLITLKSASTIPLAYIVTGAPAMFVSVILVTQVTERALLFAFPLSFAIVALISWVGLARREYFLKHNG